jgi:hypothetical protein
LREEVVENFPERKKGKYESSYTKHNKVEELKKIILLLIDLIFHIYSVMEKYVILTEVFMAFPSSYRKMSDYFFGTCSPSY